MPYTVSDTPHKCDLLTGDICNLKGGLTHRDSVGLSTFTKCPYSGSTMTLCMSKCLLDVPIN